MSNYVKIYGLQESTNVDASRVDWSEPGVPIDPSFNDKSDTKIDSSLGRADLDVTFQKLVDCPQTFTISKTNTAIDNSILFTKEQLSLHGKTTYNYAQDGNFIGTKRYVYLGFSDTNQNFTGNYNVNEIVFDSDTTGCSAKSTLYTETTNTNNKNTGGLITYSLNNCTKDRVITFSYNSTPIFKIDQTYYKKTTVSYIYAINIQEFNNQLYNVSQWAWFDDSAPNVITYSNADPIEAFTVNDVNIRNYIFFYYTTITTAFADDQKISQILNEVTHVDGNDNLSSYGSYYYTSIPTMVNTWNTDKLTNTQKEVDITKPIALYKYSGTRQYLRVATITISETTASYHLGKYKQNV